MIHGVQKKVVRVTSSVTQDAKANGYREVKVYLVADLPNGPTVIATAEVDFQLREHLGMIAQTLNNYAAQLPADIISPNGQRAVSDPPSEKEH
jgi:hypothetical protein